MKSVYILMALLLSLLTLTNNSYTHVQTTVLEGSYLGQKQPRLTPEIFALGVISTEYRDLSAFFSSDMK